MTQPRVSPPGDEGSSCAPARAIERKPSDELSVRLIRGETFVRDFAVGIRHQASADTFRRDAVG